MEDDPAKNEKKEKPGRSTGPRSDTGKSRSSMNRLDHGCRSPKAVLPGEDPAEFELNVQGWFDQYHPETAAAVALVQETALAHWHLKRNRKRLEEVEFQLPADPTAWTEANHRLFNLTSRYKTTAERNFYRCFKELEAHYRRVHRQEHLDRLAMAAAAAAELTELTATQRRTAKALKLEQAVEIEIVDGETLTSCYPTNEELREIAEESSETPLFVSRWLLFIEGVPPEYAWTNACGNSREQMANFMQNMTWDEWLEATEREEASGSGMVGPVRTFVLPKSAA